MRQLSQHPPWNLISSKSGERRESTRKPLVRQHACRLAFRFSARVGILMAQSVRQVSHRKPPPGTALAQPPRHSPGTAPAPPWPTSQMPNSQREMHFRQPIIEIIPCSLVPTSLAPNRSQETRRSVSGVWGAAGFEDIGKVLKVK